MATTTPAYVVRRVGNEYVLVRVDVPGVLLQVCSAAAGLVLLAWGARTRGLLAGLAALGGAGLVYYGVTGRNALESVRNRQGPRQGSPDQGPSHQHDVKTGPVQVPADPVDEALMESFPASDPPATGRRNTEPPPTSKRAPKDEL